MTGRVTAAQLAVGTVVRVNLDGDAASPLDGEHPVECVVLAHRLVHNGTFPNGRKRHLVHEFDLAAPDGGRPTMRLHGTSTVAVVHPPSMKYWTTSAAVVMTIAARSAEHAAAILDARLAAGGFTVYYGAPTVAFETDPPLDNV